MSVMTSPDKLQANDRTRNLILLLIVMVFVVFGLRDLSVEISFGGDNWKQGDWLINSHIEQVRRGAMGSAILYISDLTHIGPLYVVGALQAFFLVLLLGTTFLVFRPLIEKREYFLLLASPAFFLIFWTAAPQGAVRKEMIAYAALALILTYPIYRSKLAVIFATLLFIISCAAHEANTLFMPLFAALLFLVANGAEDRKFLGACGIVAGIAAVAGFLYGIHFSAVRDIADLCRPLLERGLPAAMCDGALGWMDRDASFGFAQVLAKANRPFDLYFFPVFYALSFAPLIYFASLTTRPKILYIAYALTVLPFPPLYVVAVDWGRWLDMHVTSAVFVILALGLTGRIEFATRASTLLFAAFIILGLIWAPHHEYGSMPGGLLGRIVWQIGNSL